MGTRRDCHCPIYPHPRCAACRAAVTRASDHIHVFTHGADEWEAVCGDCFSIWAIASYPVCAAAESLDIPCSAASLTEALERGRIQVFAQRDMMGVVGLN